MKPPERTWGFSLPVYGASGFICQTVHLYRSSNRRTDFLFKTIEFSRSMNFIVWSGLENKAFIRRIQEKIGKNLMWGERTMQYPMINKRQTGKRIQFFMWCTGFKPTDIQDYLGLTCVQTVYRWLDGTNIPSIDNLYALSRLFGTRVDDMLAEDGEIMPLPMACRKYMHLFMYCEKLKSMAS